MTAAARAIKAPDCGLEIIRQYEGLRLTPYLCPAGVWTIGYGHVLRHPQAGRMLTVRDGRPDCRKWSEHDAESALRLDADHHAREAARLCPRVATSPRRLGALTSFAFNLGVGNLHDSTLRRVINAGDDDEAVDQFGRWVFAGGVRLRGLVLRRAAEATLYASAPD